MVKQNITAKKELLKIKLIKKNFSILKVIPTLVKKLLYQLLGGRDNHNFVSLC